MCDEIEILGEVRKEYLKACKHFEEFNSPHEGYAVIKEELDELWDLVKAPSLARTPKNVVSMRKEAIQVAAMALRFVIDIC